MALAHVLSALRSIILDELPLPSDVGERSAYLSERFPNLTSEELEDLVKIDERKFRIYSDSIYASERRVLESKFPMTFALIAERSKGKVKIPVLVRELQRVRPWRTGLVPELVENLCHFLVEDRKDIIALDPVLAETIRFERARFFAARQEVPDEGSNFAPTELLAMSVDQVLAVQLRCRNVTRFETFQCDLIRAWHDFGETEDLPVALSERLETPLFALCSRDAENNVRWTSVGEPVSAFLQRVQFAPFALEAFAEAYLADKNTDGSPEQLFADLFSFVQVLAERGVLELVSTPMTTAVNAS
ncbi:MAG: hypothetical protein IT290_00770 [Deltaproteobacteria bacterium]|nr:hypothetical protein [Deltaproteobacteria bacterium]